MFNSILSINLPVKSQTNNLSDFGVHGFIENKPHPALHRLPARLPAHGLQCPPLVDAPLFVILKNLKEDDFHVQCLVWNATISIDFIWTFKRITSQGKRAVVVTTTWLSEITYFSILILKCKYLFGHLLVNSLKIRSPVDGHTKRIRPTSAKRLISFYLVGCGTLATAGNSKKSLSSRLKSWSKISTSSLLCHRRFHTHLSSYIPVYV